MKIYIQNLGYRGCLVVVAENEQQAKKFFSENSEYVESDGFEVFDIVPGFVYDCFGDR